MNHHLGEIVVAKIIKIRPFAFFVKLVDDDTEGLVHISELSDSYIKDIENFGTIGDELTLKIIQIDEKNGFLRLTYKGVPNQNKEPINIDNKRHAIRPDEQEFAPLKEKLQDWINEVLEKRRNDK